MFDECSYPGGLFQLPSMHMLTVSMILAASSPRVKTLISETNRPPSGAHGTLVLSLSIEGNEVVVVGRRSVPAGCFEGDSEFSGLRNEPPRRINKTEQGPMVVSVAISSTSS